MITKYGYPKQMTQEPRKPNDNLLIIIIWLIAMALVFLVINKARAQNMPMPAYTASYYTYDSCRREGTSGVWTASGERFNENDLTAAMWGVPFGTKFKVTNLRNDKSIIVRINDRGPNRKLVKQGRIIDLSKKAFFILSNGNLKLGILRVKIEKING